MIYDFHGIKYDLSKMSSRELAIFNLGMRTERIYNNRKESAGLVISFDGHTILELHEGIVVVGMLAAGVGLFFLIIYLFTVYGKHLP